MAFCAADPCVRHNMKYLKIHTLEKGWQDRDEIMLHAVFQVLADFLEQEKPEGCSRDHEGAVTSQGLSHSILYEVFVVIERLR